MSQQKKSIFYKLMWVVLIIIFTMFIWDSYKQYDYYDRATFNDDFMKKNNIVKKAFDYTLNKYTPYNHEVTFKSVAYYFPSESACNKLRNAPWYADWVLEQQKSYQKDQESLVVLALFSKDDTAPWLLTNPELANAKAHHTLLAYINKSTCLRNYSLAHQFRMITTYFSTTHTKLSLAKTERLKEWTLTPAYRQNSVIRAFMCYMPYDNQLFVMTFVMVKNGTKSESIHPGVNSKENKIIDRLKALHKRKVREKISELEQSEEYDMKISPIYSLTIGTPGVTHVGNGMKTLDAKILLDISDTVIEPHIVEHLDSIADDFAEQFEQTLK